MRNRVGGKHSQGTATVAAEAAVNRSHGEVYTQVVIHVPAAIIVAGGQPTRDSGMEVPHSKDLSGRMHSDEKETDKEES